MISKPYTYLIGWKLLNRWYYGVRYAKGCDPSDLWVKYFTSSSRVAKMRVEHGEPDVVEVRRVFDDPKKAVKWEHKVLKRMAVIGRSDFINASDGKNFKPFDPIYLERHRAARQSPLLKAKIRQKSLERWSRIGPEERALFGKVVRERWALIDPVTRSLNAKHERSKMSIQQIAAAKEKAATMRQSESWKLKHRKSVKDALSKRTNEERLQQAERANATKSTLEYKARVGEAIKNGHAKRTKEQNEERYAKANETKNNRSDELKILDSERKSAAARARWANMSPETREKLLLKRAEGRMKEVSKQKVSTALKEAHIRRTEEKELERIEKIIQTRNSWSREKRDAISEKRSESLRLAWVRRKQA